MVNNLAGKVREGRSRQAERLQIWHLAETLPCWPINSATHSSFRQRDLHPGLMLPQKVTSGQGCGKQKRGVLHARSENAGPLSTLQVCLLFTLCLFFLPLAAQCTQTVQTQQLLQRKLRQSLFDFLLRRRACKDSCMRCHQATD